VNVDGEYLKQEECIYHWGRIRTQRSKIKSLFFLSDYLLLVAGQIEKKHSCCASTSNAVGCAVSRFHVHDGDDSQLLSGYVKTQSLKKQSAINESYGVFALDCEMVGIFSHL
jgi:RNA exonuclease 1